MCGRPSDADDTDDTDDTDDADDTADTADGCSDDATDGCADDPSDGCSAGASDERPDDGCGDDVRDDDGCGDGWSGDGRSAGEEVRAADDGCEPAEEPACGDTLSAVPDTDTGSGSASGQGAGTGSADPGAAQLIPLDIPLPERVATFEAIPGIGGDTAVVLGSVSGQLADAGRIAHAPLTGAGAADPGFAGAMERADIAGRAAAALGPLVTGQEMWNDVMTDELRRQALVSAREAESEASLVLEEGEGLLER